MYINFKVKRIFFYLYVFTLLLELLQNKKKLEKRVSERNSVAVKTMKIHQNFRITLPLPFPFGS